MIKDCNSLKTSLSGRDLGCLISALNSAGKDEGARFEPLWVRISKELGEFDRKSCVTVEETLDKKAKHTASPDRAKE